MKNFRQSTLLSLMGFLVITLNACSSGGGGGIASITSNGTTPTSPYPDPNNPSAFPTQADTEEGSSGNNTPATAGSLSIGETTYHTIYPIGDIDWIAVTLTGGTQYEFTVDNVSYLGVPKLELYSDGDTSTPIEEDWGYFYKAFNPRILFQPSGSGTYYLKVKDDAGGVLSYTLSSRVFSDGDGDSYSTHYDCNDGNTTIYPWAANTSGEVVDHSCSGYTWPDEAAGDSFEPDGAHGDFSNAGSLPELNGDTGDIIHRDDVYAETHTIHMNDVDVFKITVPAKSAKEIMEVERSTAALLESRLYDSSYVEIPGTGTYGADVITHWLDNDTDSPKDYYLKVYATVASNTAGYVIGVADGGTDADGDFYYTRAQGAGWDCDDSNATIYAGAAETPGDGVDSNCNSEDDT